MPLMPVVQLVTNLVVRPLSRAFNAAQSTNVEDGTDAAGDGTGGGVGGGEAAVRLSLLATTTLLAVGMPQFGIAAGLTGCLCIVTSNILPPLCHLRLCTWPKRPLAAMVDTLLLAAGGGALVQFTSQFLLELLADGRR